MKSHALAIGLIVSTGVHAAVFSLAPGIQVGPPGQAARAFHAVQLPPEVRVPPPPAAIPRPATPRVSAAPDLAEDATIAPTTFAHNPVSSLAPPPRLVAGPREDRPAFVAYEVAPKLRNGPEILRLLQRRYPPNLRNAGVEGAVTVWIHLDGQGHPTTTRLREGSGYSALDAVALDVAMQMEFTPALNRDRPVAVWVAQVVQFQVL